MDSEGNAVVTYSYDAWGNPTGGTRSSTDPNANPLYQYNPLRYRGYVYDFETGLYYLQSRYYTPKTGRFLNADGYTSTGQGTLRNNMFAYCLNNPINIVDIGGNRGGSIQKMLDFFNRSISATIDGIGDAVDAIEEKLSQIDFTYSNGLNASYTPGGIIFNLQFGVYVDQRKCRH